MQTFLFFAFAIICLISVAILYGMIKQQRNQYKDDLQTGEKIDTIIHNNSNISDDEWSSWLQERNCKQK